MIPLVVQFSYIAVLILLVFSMMLFVGVRLGCMACYGFNVTFYRRLTVQKLRPEFCPQPGHVDRKCGLRPMNSFLFFQATTVLILFVYLAVWLFILKKYGNEIVINNIISHLDVETIYPIFLIAISFILFLQFWGLVTPVFSVRNRVIAKKRQLETEADKIWDKINRLTMKLERNKFGTTECIKIQYLIEKHRRRYSDIERMRFWPLTTDSAGAVILIVGQSVAVFYPVFQLLVSKFF